MEKAKNIVLVICGTILFFGSRAAYGTWMYIIVWAIGVAMLVFGIVGLHKNRSNRKAEASKRDPAENGFYDPNCHVSNNYEQPPEAHRSRKTVKITIIGFAAFSLIIGIITTANYDPSKANRMTDEERQEMLDLIPPAPIPIGTQAFFSTSDEEEVQALARIACVYAQGYYGTNCLVYCGDQIYIYAIDETVASFDLDNWDSATADAMQLYDSILKRRQQTDCYRGVNIILCADTSGESCLYVQHNKEVLYNALDKIKELHPERFEDVSNLDT